MLQVVQPAGQITHGAPIEEAQRQAEEVAHDLAAEGGVDPVGEIGEQQLLEHPQDAHHHRGEAEHQSDR